MVMHHNSIAVATALACIKLSGRSFNRVPVKAKLPTRILGNPTVSDSRKSEANYWLLSIFPVYVLS